VDLVVFEENREFVLTSFREGKFDYAEITTQIAEKLFFKFLLSKKVIQHLGATYPSPRVKEEVPNWAAVVSNISLRFHGTQSFHSFPYIVRMGGLIDALGPEIASRKMEPGKRTLELRCPGFNKKNHYPRKTPWDQDFLRKFARDTEADKMIEWYNKEINWCLREIMEFDKEGIFIGDATYIFVPDNEKYENSTRLLFDEGNHPVDPEKVDWKKNKAKYQWRRCYQMVSLIHTNSKMQFFATVSLKIIDGKASPQPVLYELVNNFVKREGKKVMKKLILDRGFICGEKISICKEGLGIDIVIGVREDMDIYDDTLRIAQGFKLDWIEYKEDKEPAIDKEEALLKLPPGVQRRERARQETVAKKKREEEEKEGKPVTLEKTLVSGIHDFTLWQSCKVPIHTVISREIYSDGHEDKWILATTERFTDPRKIREDYKLRTTIEERHRQLKLFWDLARFHSVSFNLVVNHIVSTILTYSLLQMRTFAEFQGGLNQITLVQLKRYLEPRVDRIVIYYKQYFAFQTLYEHEEILLTLEEKSRIKILRKTRQLKRAMLDFPYSPRPP
jgi:hypothetical protein